MLGLVVEDKIILTHVRSASMLVTTIGGCGKYVFFFLTLLVYILLQQIHEK
jgi:hypothetical protein